MERRRKALVEFIRESYAEGELVIEVGVGERDGIACDLADAGFKVTVTDVRDVEVDGSVSFVRDDVTSPEVSVYEGASLVYSVRPPYEIHEDIDWVARSVGADTLLVTLADEGTPLDLELLNRGGNAFFLRQRRG